MQTNEQSAGYEPGNEQFNYAEFMDFSFPVPGNDTDEGLQVKEPPLDVE